LKMDVIIRIITQVIIEISSRALIGREWRHILL